MVAAAIVGGAAITAGGSMLAANQQSKAQGDAMNSQMGFQRYAFNTMQKDLSPYMQAGQKGLDQYMNLLGLGTGGTDIQKTLENTPGYQFQLGQGMKAQNNAASAMGMNLSGNNLQALDQFGQGLASSNYQQILGNYANLANLGESAAAGMAQNSTNQLNQMGQTMGNYYTNMGNIQAGQTAGLTGALSGGLNSFANYQMMNQVLGGLGGGGGGINPLSAGGSAVDSMLIP